MEIHNRLLESPGKINPYFNDKNSEGWLEDYRKKASSIEHDEPWLTLLALYSLFGDQSSLNDPGIIRILERLLNASLANWNHGIKTIKEIKVEYQPHEILSYRDHLHGLSKKSIYHLYPDRNKILEDKRDKKNASFEGNTNLDVYLELECVEGLVGVLIEAKFLSDISYQITYNPVRDQIIRNIDCGIDMKFDRKELDDCYFYLLTPGLFRPKEFGSRKRYLLDAHGPDRSRLYCYKMLDYVDPVKLKSALPHRHSNKNIDWDRIASHIGWLTFEDMIELSNNEDLVTDPDERKEINDFFIKRNLY